jgi:hypothetical protein
MTSETCPRSYNMACALFVWARTGLKIQSLLNAHTKHEHFGRRAGHSVSAAVTLEPDAYRGLLGPLSGNATVIISFISEFEVHKPM